MRFVQFEQVAARLRGKSVAVVGSAPSSLLNPTGLVDSHDVVVRVNEYKTGEAQGYRTDVHYSFYGQSIKKAADRLKEDGVQLCMCKCPDSQPIDSEWHRRMGKMNGVDFRYIYNLRRAWWWCDTFIPDDQRFLKKFQLLDRHIPTTGFAAILDVLDCEPRELFVTGFDFFRSGVHNVDEAWRPGNPKDPIRHLPEVEAQWLADNRERFPLRFDGELTKIIEALESSK